MTPPCRRPAGGIGSGPRSTAFPCGGAAHITSLSRNPRRGPGQTPPPLKRRNQPLPRPRPRTYIRPQRPHPVRPQLAIHAPATSKNMIRLPPFPRPGFGSSADDGQHFRRRVVDESFRGLKPRIPSSNARSMPRSRARWTARPAGIARPGHDHRAPPDPATEIPERTPDERRRADRETITDNDGRALHAGHQGNAPMRFSAASPVLKLHAASGFRGRERAGHDAIRQGIKDFSDLADHSAALVKGEFSRAACDIHHRDDPVWRLDQLFDQNGR